MFSSRIHLFPVAKSFAFVSMFTCLFCLMFQSAQAMSVRPTVVEMATTGKYSRANLSVINTGKAVLPAEIRIFRIELDKNGKVSEKEAGDEFLVFPPQQMIAAGATQNFRVQWVGDPMIKKSQNYLFSVNQLPVELPKKSKAGVQIVFNFGVVVNVRPPQGKADLVLVKSGFGKDTKGKLRPALTVKNKGNIHASLSDATVRLSSGKWSKKFMPSTLRQKIGVALVQPGKTRRFLLPVDVPANSSALKASIDYRYGRR